MNRSAGLLSKRFLTVVCCCFLGLLILGVAGPRQLSPAAFAQEEGEKPPAPTAESETPKEKSMIAHMIESLGPVFLVLLGFISVSLIAIIVLLSMDLRMGAAVPPDFVADFTDVVNKR